MAPATSDDDPQRSLSRARRTTMGLFPEFLPWVCSSELLGTRAARGFGHRQWAPPPRRRIARMSSTSLEEESFVQSAPKRLRTLLALHGVLFLASSFEGFGGCAAGLCSSRWNGKPFAGVRIGQASHPGPGPKGLDALRFVGPGLLDTIKGAIQKIVEQAVKQSRASWPPAAD